MCTRSISPTMSIWPAPERSPWAQICKLQKQNSRLCAQAAALGGDLGADGELTVPALLESEDPASVLVVRVRAAYMLEHAASARACTAFRSSACTYSVSHHAVMRMRKRSRATGTRFALPRLTHWAKRAGRRGGHP